MRVLSREAHSEGNDVRAVQYFLLGMRFYRGEVDGVYGPETENAVRTYQIRECLTPVDGIVGRATLADMIAQGLPILAEPDQDLPRPPDGMKPITDNETRQRRWGRIQWEPAPEPGNPENIRITNGFEDENIVHVDCPVWGSKKVRLHRQVVEHYLAFMEAVIKGGLQSRLITFDGGFNARYIRGSRTMLSNHAWGTAFDVNADDNPLGRTPPFIGERGCVRELVSIGSTYGWYWGDWFKRRDGNHWEHI